MVKLKNEKILEVGRVGGGKGGGVPRDPGGCNGKIMDADKVGKKLFVNF